MPLKAAFRAYGRQGLKKTALFLLTRFVRHSILLSVGRYTLQE